MTGWFGSKLLRRVFSHLACPHGSPINVTNNDNSKMENSQRVAVAFLCGCLQEKNGTIHSSIYDYSQGAYVSCSYSNNGGNVSIFDCGRNCFLTGRYPSFYDYGVSQYVSLTRVNDNLYNVFDYHTSSSVSVTCRGAQISVFDYEKGQYFSYQLT